ncbi:MAG TPA: hypothetical protein VN764_11245 [Polyangiaceae bacterium]|nr:hypothetical protein [Polyangiaceae bacterium]
MSSIEVQMHPKGSGIADFLEVAHIVFRNDPNWVPPLNIMQKDQLSPKSPFFQHAEVVLFTARRNGQLVGRCSAQIDREHLKRYEDATGFFGFLDTVDDVEVVQALLAAAKSWLKDRGMQRIIGPMNLSVNQEIGTLIDGFDTPPMVMMGHSRPYQNELILKSGLVKCRDLFAWRWRATAQMPTRSLKALAAMKEQGARFRSADLAKDIDELIDIQDDAWRNNWGHVSMTRAEATQLRNELKLIIDPEITVVVEIEGKAVGMALSIPNLNEVISDFEGSISPTKIAKLLWRLKVDHPRSARVAMLGIREHVRKQKKWMPLALALIAELNRRGYQRGYQWGELSWTLEDNSAVNTMIKVAGGERYKTYRVYEGPLS